MDMQASAGRRKSQVSFHDFLPNSIMRSPQRALGSHSQTSIRLGLISTKAS